MKLTAKTQAALSVALIVFIVTHPMTYRLVDSLLGGLVGRIASVTGCPSTTGLIAHSLVAGAVAYQMVL